MPDLNTFDTFESSTQIVLIQDDHIDREKLEELEEPIKRQYIDLESMGVDLTKDIPQLYLYAIYGNLIDFVNENYTAVTEYDMVRISPQKVLEVGKYVYSFITNDATFNILPSYLIKIDSFTIDQFESYLRHTLRNDSSKFKASFVASIREVIDRLNGLQRIRQAVTKDNNYQYLLKKYMYYMELVNYGDSDRFLYNYIMPVLRNNFEQILWRTF